MKTFEICRPGTFMDASGRVTPVTEDALREMATGYNIKLRRAALVVGHPKMDDPAYGWVKELDYRDGALLASPEQVDDKFSSAVKDGRFPNRSAAFYLPDSVDNPTPGRYYLKHVGFLGGIQPAVDGLRPVEFGAFDGEAGNDLVVSLAGYEGYIRHQERRRVVRENEINVLADTLTGKVGGKVVLRLGEREAFVALATNLSASSAVIHFGSGEDAEQIDGFALLKRLMEQRAPLVMLGEHGPAKNQPKGTVKLSMPDGVPVDSDRTDLHDRAAAYQVLHNVSYRDAVRAVKGGR